MKLIPLTQGKFAQVDDEDYEWLNKWKWYVAKPGRITYAMRHVPKGEQRIRMHREIMGLGRNSKQIVDHINHDGLDNRKSNLRICTSQQNNFNSHKRTDNKSGFIGVYFISRSKKWSAGAKLNGKTCYLGQYPTAIAAALAYDEFIRKTRGEFAMTNLPKVPDKKAGV